MGELRKAVKSNTGVTLTIRVVSRSSKISFTRESDTQYKIRLTSAPVDGAANDQLVRVLADRLSLPARNIEIIQGETARLKRLKIVGLDAATISQLLQKK